MTTRNEFAAQLIERRFLSDYRELFSFYDAAKVFQSLSSYLQLNHSVEELTSAATSPAAYRQMLALAAITLLNRDAVIPIADLSEAAEFDLAKLRQETGIDVELIPAPAPKPPTATELLEQEVREDFVKLSGTKMMEKRRSNRAYESTYQRIAGTLGSRATTLHDLAR